jgi:hypothetical protein
MLQFNGELDYQPLSEQIILGARRMPVKVSADLEAAYLDSIEVTEQSVRDMLAIDQGRLRNNLRDEIGMSLEPRSSMSADIVIDERKTMAVHAYDARQTKDGVEVDVIRGEPPQLFPNAFLFRGGIYVRYNKRAIKKVGDIHIWDWAGPRRLAEQIPETVLAKFGRLFNNTFEILFGRGSKG